MIIGGGVWADLRQQRLSITLRLMSPLSTERTTTSSSPFLYQVATATLSPADIAHAYPAHLKKQNNAEVLLGEVSVVDYKQKQVKLKDGSALPTIGSLSPWIGKQLFWARRWEKYAPGLKTLDEATHIRSEVLSAFESAERSPGPKEQRVGSLS